MNRPAVGETEMVSIVTRVPPNDTTVGSAWFLRRRVSNTPLIKCLSVFRLLEGLSLPRLFWIAPSLPCALLDASSIGHRNSPCFPSEPKSPWLFHPQGGCI